MKTLLYTTSSPKSRDNVIGYLDYLDGKSQGKQKSYSIQIKQLRVSRTVTQNRYYWAILTSIANETGDTKEQLHMVYGLMFNSVEVQGMKIPGSTKDLDTREMTIYINKIKDHAKEFHTLYIPAVGDKAYGVWEQVTNEKYDNLFAEI